MASNLAGLVSTCATARQNALDSALTAIRAYALAIAAEAELPDTAMARRVWCNAMVERLDAAWHALDAIRWDYGPPKET